jgi:hypothetical protein
MGLAAVGHKKLIGPVTAGDIFWTSAAIGRQLRRTEEKLRHRMNPHPNELSGESSTEAKHLLRVID